MVSCIFVSLNRIFTVLFLSFCIFSPFFMHFLLFIFSLFFSPFFLCTFYHIYTPIFKHLRKKRKDKYIFFILPFLLFYFFKLTIIFSFKDNLNSLGSSISILLFSNTNLGLIVVSSSNFSLPTISLIISKASPILG